MSGFVSAGDMNSPDVTFSEGIILHHPSDRRTPSSESGATPASIVSVASNILLSTRTEFQTMNVESTPSLPVSPITRMSSIPNALLCTSSTANSVPSSAASAANHSLNKSTLSRTSDDVIMSRAASDFLPTTTSSMETAAASDSCACWSAASARRHFPAIASAPAASAASDSGAGWLGASVAPNSSTMVTAPAASVACSSSSLHHQDGQNIYPTRRRNRNHSRSPPPFATSFCHLSHRSASVSSRSLRKTRFASAKISSPNSASSFKSASTSSLTSPTSPTSSYASRIRLSFFASRFRFFLFRLALPIFLDDHRSDESVLATGKSGNLFESKRASTAAGQTQDRTGV